MPKVFIALAIALLLTACTQSGSQIGTAPRLCCPGDYARYHTYRVETENMPGFLQRYVVDTFDTVFMQKGLRRDAGGQDLHVLLRYNHINLNPEQQSIDPLVRIEALTVELNYVAEIEIEISEAQTRKVVWAGTISRIHRVSPGEYMHEERARPEFLQAFTTVLESWPSH
jgi:hypothetical protein